LSAPSGGVARRHGWRIDRGGGRARIARLGQDRHRGRAFGSYRSWKGLGKTLGPLLGGVLISMGGYGLFPALFRAEPRL